MTRRIVLQGGTLFDGTGTEPYQADIAIEGDRFAAVGTGLAGDEIIDVRGCSLLPGLFDAHVHVLGIEPRIKEKAEEPFTYQFYNGARNLRKLLTCGITTARDCAGADLGVKKALADGLIAGPRLQISITAISQTGGHMDGWTPSTNWITPYYITHPGRPDSIGDGVDGVRKVVRRTLRAGADFIKVLATHSGGARYDRTRFSMAELEAIAAEADASGVPVVTHAYGSAAVKDALRVGCRSVEHIAELDDEAIELFLEKDAWLVPTIGMHYARLRPAETLDAEDKREAIGHQMDQARDRGRAAERAYADLARARAAGVKIVMGTDYGNKCGDNLSELEAMTYGGMSSAEALVAASLSAAQLMGLDDDLGSVEPGKLADLVVLTGSNPLDLTGMKARITSVYKEGQIVHRAGQESIVAATAGRS